MAEREETAAARAAYEALLGSAFARGAAPPLPHDEDSLEKRREECERKARRGEMDPRLEFTFQLLIDGTGLPRHAIMDHVFEGNMLDDINQLFLPHMRNKLLWYYQAGEPGGPKKLFLSDGWDVRFTGVCIYMFRINVSKQLPEEGFHKDLFCGVLNAESVGLVTAAERVVEHVYAAALAHPAPDADEDDARFPIVKNQLLPGLRSFCSALKVCEEVCNQTNLFADGRQLAAELAAAGGAGGEAAALRELVRSPQAVADLEDRVREWIKRVMEILSESEQLRREADASGPQDELEYWKKRGAQFSQLVSYLQDKEVQLTLAALQLAGSKAVRQWRDTDHKITFCYNEAKDNAKFIQAMEKCCHSLYLDSPERIQESLLGLLQTVRLVHSVSQFYNSSERISSLMVKITNQMIETCKQYITCRGAETVWSQPRAAARAKLAHCIELNRAYRGAYQRVRAQPFLPHAQPFAFSENYVFGKFDAFCKRLHKILAVFDLMDDFNHLFATRMEGLLLGEELEEAMATFGEASRAVTGGAYDYLEARDAAFDAAHAAFEARAEALRRHVADTVERAFASVWETPHCFKFLVRFEKVNEKIAMRQLGEKYERVVRYCEREVDKITRMFKRQRDDPPVPRNYPPVAGRIKWARCLQQHMSEAVGSVRAHGQLRARPAAADVLRKHAAASALLLAYEEHLLLVWMNQNAGDVDEWLSAPLLSVSAEGRVVAAAAREARLVAREAACLAELRAPLPAAALALLARRPRLAAAGDALAHALHEYAGAVRAVKAEVRPLLLPAAARLAAVLLPGLRAPCAGAAWRALAAAAARATHAFRVLTARVHDVYAHRIQDTLAAMQDTALFHLPEETPWTMEQFLENVEAGCRQASVELERRSRMVEEAVGEVVALVRRAGRPPRPLPPDLALLAADSDDEGSEGEGGGGSAGSSGGETGGAQDWSAVDACFDDPHRLLAAPAGGLSKATQEMVKNAVHEMRRHYSRKVADVLVRVTRRALDLVIRPFAAPRDEGAPIFLLSATLAIPAVAVTPSLEEIQAALAAAGRLVLAVAKGVAQWSAPPQARVGWKKLAGHQPGQLLEVVSRLDEQVSSAAGGGGAGAGAGAGAAALAQRSLRVMEARARRRKHYRLESEEKPSFPFQPRNFYGHVMENKEIVKTLAALAVCTQHIQPEVSALVKRWRPYHYVWRCERTARALLGWGLAELEAALKRHAELRARLETEPRALRVRAVLVATDRLHHALLAEIKNGTHRIGAAMRKKYKREMEYVYAIMGELERKLERGVRELDDVRAAMDTLRRIRDQEADMELRIDPVEEAFNVMSRYSLAVSRAELDAVDSLRYSWQRLQARALAAHVALLEAQPSLERELRANLQRFREDKAAYVHEYRHAGPMQPGLSPRDASDRLILFQNRFDGMWRKLQTYQSGEQLFGLPATEYPELAQIRKELNLLQKLYKLYNDVIDRVSSYYDIPWGDVNIEEINNELMEFQNRCRKLPKGLKEWPAFFALKKTIDDFNDMCPLLELMANRAMKPRHWQRIMEVTGYVFHLDDEDFCLKNILEAPLLPHKEDIEDICISAMKEKDIEAKLRQVTNEWSVHELTFQTFNNRGELLLRGDTTAETIAQLEDSLMVLGSLLSNRYNAPFRKQIQQWLYDLQSTNEILERWLLVQNMWVYLEAVFVGGDIAKQLPKEAKRFSKIDKSWQKIMQRAHETPGVVSCCVGDDLLRQLLPHLQEQLELCQKSLSGYLEKKRTMFPRFFFVSDPALLEVLGQASDSHTIQNHLLSIFDNIRYVTFHDIEYNKMMAVVSSEGEEIKLERAVRAEGSVETWLTALLQAAQGSLHAIIRAAVALLNDPAFNLLQFLDKMPAQVGLLGIQIIWTRDAELALAAARQDKKIMAETNNRFLELLNTLIDQTTRDLAKIERIKFETLITIHVHQRDIFDMLCRLNVRSATDFEWLKQCRFYFKEDADKTWISVTDVTFTYQNEYLGCTERLVITPLTDRCYITLAQALAMSMGGAPCGPAGTGKTETVKDMGKTLAKYVVVFNCSDQMDYRGLGRIYKGLAQSGSWGCFDEFNRIELPVLSVAAQQVAVVLAAKKDKRRSFVFTDGDLSDMCPEFGIFITMNPGYAGRKELPENLKIQFRTVAMMVPDRQIIIRVKLASCGFLENITLARKFYTLYKLCEEQLTKQVHYDFGLRNILSVLRTLGAVKRVNSKDNESTIVMRVLRDMNLSKLIDEDEPLFISLVADLFPNQALEKTTYPDLEEAIRVEVEKTGLVFHPPWILKIIQLYETQRVRHGIMTLGPPGAGKTTCIHTLMNALTEVENPHKEMRMNPKAITAAQMFGRLDVATNDWTDGIFSALWRKTLRMRTGEHIWLVLDGPVDSIWIENLNSVLDDNKTLTLANGDRLTMAPTSKIIFEPENIDNASPATVSRNGMVYMSSSGLDWDPVVRAWLKTRSALEAEVFGELFAQTFAAVYTWCTQNLTFCMRVLQANVVLQMLRLLEGLVPPPRAAPAAAAPAPADADDDDERERPEEAPPPAPAHLRRVYLFALYWGFGALLETADRARLDAHLEAGFAGALDFPRHPNGRPSVGFDFYVRPSGEWALWDELVTAYQYPDTAAPDYASILVPIVDNVRVAHLVHCVAKQGRAVLLLGEQGSAKTVMMKAYMRNADPERFVGRSFNFSSATSPYQFQKTIESYVEKRSGMTFGPPGGKRMLVFIDDINLPQINEWGDQITNEIVRQTMSMGGFYSLEKPGDFTTIVDIQFLGAMGQPGGGRNDIPARLKRQFAIFNCPLPNNESIDKIFKVIGEGHYNAKRGFPLEVRQLVKKVIPLTRELWARTRLALLPTPAKFHYVFSLRELSRVWQGLVGTLPSVVDSERCLMLLWKHEVARVFADRFTHQSDKDWFHQAMNDTVDQLLGPEYKKMMEKDPVFVDFMRDAPEPTGEEGEDADMELPKVYEPVFALEELRDRLDMFLAQFNEMVRGAGMDLVFFPDAMLHLVKISRVIRHPRGNVMLVGVGGSGKQSLTKLSTFIAGYRSFQIALTRSYNVANFLEDLKLLYRTCGVQGKGTAFIFTDLDIKEEGFLEYLNNILSSGVISNLFTKDEQQEIVTELTPVMKRENQKRSLTNELVMEYFLNRTCQNLHVVLCFSPVSEAFRYRAMRFPALISGCTIDWFQPWPKDALVQVADHFLADFQIECTAPVKKELVTVLGTIQDVVSQVSVEYFQRFRRSSHVTPKSYLNFIGGYKAIYQLKQRELGDGARRMDTGLERLRQAAVSVGGLKQDLALMEQDLALASEKAGRVLSEVTERAMQAELVKNQVQVVKEKAEALVAYIAEEKAKAEAKLQAAKPALEEAEAALNTIKPAHIATVRKLGRPPHLIMRIMDCVLVLFQRRLHPVIPDTAAPCPKPSWAESLKMMASTTFLLQLQNYPKDIINNEMVEHLAPYFEMEDYNMDTAKRVCGDVAGLLSWTKAMAFFHSVNKEVLPLKANLLLQEARLKVAMEDLASAERQLAERERSLRAVKDQYEAAVAEKQQLTDAANACLRKMTAATALINGLAGEKLRWTRQSKDFKEQLGRLVGDVVLATGFLSYCGPYNQQFRTTLLDTWTGILEARRIPLTERLDITAMLVESAEVGEWTLQGLPNDELSVQNALIVTKASSYPLLVDPQSQGKNWIKNKEGANELQITSLNHKYFRTHLEDSLSLGRPLLVEDVGVDLDPVIDNVLEKNFIKSGSIEKVVVGDKECDVMPGFMLYITTKLPNPAYSPEVSAKTSIIDFTVTVQGLEDQLLGRVILMEKADLEEERVALFESVMRNRRSMKELEGNLLGRLSASEGSLVDDEALIRVLQVTKATAEEVNEKLRVAAATEAKIGRAREQFRAVAARGSILYFLIVEMSNVNIMYQNSLKQFLTIFDNSITKSAKSAVAEERIDIILRFLTREVWAFTLRSLYERHKALFTLMLAMKIDLQRGRVSHAEFTAFVKGGASLDLNAVAPKPFRWILDITWLNLVEISKLDVFSDVLTRISSSEKEWRVWYEKARPEQEPLPGGYQGALDAFRTLLLVRSWSPDRTLSQARNYIVDSLGPEYGEGCILNLEQTWAESEPRTPLVCILSTGSDPSAQVAALAKAKDIVLRAVSMGQGQEVVARRMIGDSMAGGGWVLLQNTHLSLPFCVEAMDALVEADHVHASFRLWLTTEVHAEFPIGLLQMAIKFTNEPPQGIRASMKRTYQNITQDTLEYSPLAQWPPLLYAVAFLHTVVQERRKFGPLGWNVPYEFNQADYAASVCFVQNHLDEIDPKKGISWPTICYMLGEVMYGGRVTDDFDKRLLTTFTSVWFCDVLLRPGFEFYKGYKVPQTRSLQGYVDYINQLPLTDTPEVFGLHANADITYQINSAKDILDTILSVQPKEGGSQGGETRESIVYRLAEDMLEKLPRQYVGFEVREALHKMGAFLPMNIFLRQEIDRIQRVIKTVQSTLSDLKLAIDGTIVMSQGLRASLDAMFDARIPDTWLKVSWESATLGFWYTELLEREQQYRAWLRGGRPAAFWMTGFFNPQGFLTAMRQEVTRGHKGWALDSVVLQNHITRLNREDVGEGPAEGVYVHGLFLEGASLDRKSGKLTESKPKVLYEQMPVIYIFAINTTAGKDPRLYECPIYRKPQRTDAKYVGSIDFETDTTPRHWTLRGVALLCDIK